MPVSRRRFLRFGTLGGLAAGLMLKSPSLAFASDLSRSSDQTAGFDYSRASFAPHVGSTFLLRQGKQLVNLTLVNLTDYEQLSRKAKGSKVSNTESFVLAFRAPKNISRSMTYQLDHPKLGTFDLFIARNGDRDNMTAVVNRLV